MHPAGSIAGSIAGITPYTVHQLFKIAYITMAKVSLGPYDE